MSSPDVQPLPPASTLAGIAAEARGTLPGRLRPPAAPSPTSPGHCACAAARPAPRGLPALKPGSHLPASPQRPVPPGVWLAAALFTLKTLSPLTASSPQGPLRTPLLDTSLPHFFSNQRLPSCSRSARSPGPGPRAVPALCSLRQLLAHLHSVPLCHGCFSPALPACQVSQRSRFPFMFPSRASLLLPYSTAHPGRSCDLLPLPPVSVFLVPWLLRSGLPPLCLSIALRLPTCFPASVLCSSLQRCLGSLSTVHRPPPAPPPGSAMQRVCECTCQLQDLETSLLPQRPKWSLSAAYKLGSLSLFSTALDCRHCWIVGTPLSKQKLGGITICLHPTSIHFLGPPPFLPGS